MTTCDIMRPIPAQPWSRLAFVALGLTAVVALGWEIRCRSLGYAPGLDDTSDLWAEQRRAVLPGSTVIIGASRALFDLDLDVLERSLGQRPVQLALVGSCVAPVLQDLAADPTFRGTVLCDVVPGLVTVPPMAPPYHNSLRALERHRTQTLAQRWSHLLSLPLERTFAALQQEDLTLAALIKQVRIPNRPGAQIGPALPPHFATIERDRRTRMRDRVLTDAALRERIGNGWIPLFTPPPKPHWIPDAAFGPFMQSMLDGRFKDCAAAVAAIRARGGRVVFLHLPSTGPLKELEDRLTPRAMVWDRLLAETGAAGVYSDDVADLQGFDCPEWSHLSAADSQVFSERLAPHLQALLAR